MGHKVYIKYSVKKMAALEQPGEITFEDLFKALLASRRVEQKETIKKHFLFREGRSYYFTSFGES